MPLTTTADMLLACVTGLEDRGAGEFADAERMRSPGDPAWLGVPDAAIPALLITRIGDELNTIDVLICAGNKDVDRLFIHSLQSCFHHFDPLGHVYVVSDVSGAVRQVLKQHGICSRGFTVLDDREVLAREFHALPGWCRQQAIKLLADKITQSQFVACLGADTIILRRVLWSDFICCGQPILYFNRYPHTERHLEYERRRVKNVARLLGVEPTRSLPFGDFIIDLNVLEAENLRGLRCHLGAMHGENGFRAVFPARSETLDEKAAFGEWSIYAVYLLDVKRSANEIRNSANRHLAQVHSPTDFREFGFDAKIVHFVSKEFDVNQIVRELRERKLAQFSG